MMTMLQCRAVGCQKPSHSSSRPRSSWSRHNATFVSKQTSFSPSWRRGALQPVAQDLWTTPATHAAAAKVSDSSNHPDQTAHAEFPPAQQAASTPRKLRSRATKLADEQISNGTGTLDIVRADTQGQGTVEGRKLLRTLPNGQEPQDESHDGTRQLPSLVRTVTLPLPRVLLLHTGGTLGMDPIASFETSSKGSETLRRGTGGIYAGEKGSGLKPGTLLENVLAAVPEIKAFANLELRVVFNKDSSNVGPAEWTKLARLLHKERDAYDAFLILHGTDTMAYTAAALSMMLTGFKKPIVLTGSQLPLAMPRSDARQNIVDSVTCLTSFFYPPHIQLQEVAVCFGGRLMRGNRCQKTHSSFYQAFDTLTYPYLANLGVEVDWNKEALLDVAGVYRPRFELDPRVIRIPIVPGSDPELAYGDLFGRGVRGIILEAFGVGNMPSFQASGWLKWLKTQRKKGLYVYLASQCSRGHLQPELYKSGLMALSIGVESGPQMTPECAVVKMMQCLKYKDIPLGVSLAGEM